MRHLQTKVPSFNLGTLTSFVLRHQIGIAVTILVKPLIKRPSSLCSRLSPWETYNRQKGCYASPTP